MYINNILLFKKRNFAIKKRDIMIYTYNTRKIHDISTPITTAACVVTNKVCKSIA